MPNGADIAAGLTSLKVAFDLAKALIGVRDESIIRERVIELQDKIVAARESQLAALDQINALKREVAELKEWDAEKQQYELVELRQNVAPGHGGALAYALKKDAGSSEPYHLLCPNCFRDRKSILQQETRMPGRVDILWCNACRSEINRTGVTYADTPRASKPTRRPRQR